jgi:hypothetical protein
MLALRARSTVVGTGSEEEPAMMVEFEVEFEDEVVL